MFLNTSRSVISHSGYIIYQYNGNIGKLISGIIYIGYFVPPTVITGLKDSSRCMQEEIFGPVVCIAKFSGDDEGNILKNFT